VRHFARIEARFAIVPDDLTMRLCGSDCASMQRFAVASAIAAKTSSELMT
jgi:hypothetical protein